MFFTDEEKKEVVYLENGTCLDLFVYVSKSSQSQAIKVEEVTGDIEIYGEKIVTVDMIGELNINASIDNKYMIYEDLKSNITHYDIEKMPWNGTTTYYGKFEGLITGRESYITKSLIGNESVESLPIYRYDFKPVNATSGREISKSLNIKKPKILITGCIHGGDEKICTWIIYNFFNQICTKHKEDDMFRWLRYNVEFTVVPIVNPWGFNHGVRTNGNGVDLNREFLKDESDMQIETRLMKNIIDNEKFDAIIDLHTMWEGNGRNTSWIISENEETTSLDNNVLIYLSRVWQQRYNFMEQDEDIIFGYLGEADYIDSSLMGAQMRAYAYRKGYKFATTLEVANKVNYNDEELFGILTSNIYIDLLSNYVVALLKKIVN